MKFVITNLGNYIYIVILFTYIYIYILFVVYETLFVYFPKDKLKYESEIRTSKDAWEKKLVSAQKM